MKFMQMQAAERAEERKEAERFRAQERQAERLETKRIRLEERALAERLRKEDLERMEQERRAQQRAHEEQLELLKTQMAALAAQKATDPGTRAPNTKLPIFDLEKDKETFNIWKARWLTHIQGNKISLMKCPKERNARLMMELTAALPDFTVNWILNLNLEDEMVTMNGSIFTIVFDKRGELDMRWTKCLLEVVSRFWTSVF